MVVDGWIYDFEGPYEIRLSTSVAFANLSNFTAVNNADVIIRDNQGNVQELSQVGLGIYHTNPQFRGRVGLSYQVEVSTASGQVYVSDFTELLPVSEISGLLLEEDLELFDITGEQVFFPVAFAQELEEAGNFYRWRVARNGVFFNEPEDIILQTDRFINGNFFRNELKGYDFFENDTATVHIESLSLESYNFLRFLRRQTTNLGSPAGTNPGTLSGNIRNKNDENEVVLGYFGASSVSIATESVNN